MTQRVDSSYPSQQMYRQFGPCQQDVPQGQNNPYSQNLQRQNLQRQNFIQGQNNPYSQNLQSQNRPCQQAVPQREKITQFTCLSLPVSLGEGTYATVSLGTMYPKSTLCAIKKNKYPWIGKNECQILKTLWHKNIVAVLGEKSELNNETQKLQSHTLVMEYCPTDLLNIIPTGCFSDPKKFFHLTMDLFAGIDFMHSKDILHLDLHAGNVLIDATGVAKITDFGLAVIGTETFKSKKQKYGGHLYRPPEALFHKQYGKATDIYDGGLILFAVLHNRLPICYANNTYPKNTKEQIELVSHAVHTHTFSSKCTFLHEKFKPSNQSEKQAVLPMVRAIADTLHPNPEKRPTARKLIEIVKKCWSDPKYQQANQSDNFQNYSFSVRNQLIGRTMKCSSSTRSRQG